MRFSFDVCNHNRVRNSPLIVYLLRSATARMTISLWSWILTFYLTFASKWTTVSFPILTYSLATRIHFQIQHEFMLTFIPTIFMAMEILLHDHLADTTYVIHVFRNRKFTSKQTVLSRFSSFQFAVIEATIWHFISNDFTPLKRNWLVVVSANYLYDQSIWVYLK